MGEPRLFLASMVYAMVAHGTFHGMLHDMSHDWPHGARTMAHYHGTKPSMEYAMVYMYQYYIVDPMVGIMGLSMGRPMGCSVGAPLCVP